MRHHTLPDVPKDITARELDALKAPKVSGKGTSTGWRFVYARGTKPGNGKKCSEVCRTFRVRLKRNYDVHGNAVYEEFSGGWTCARDAAKFVAGLLRSRYGHDWPAMVKEGRPQVFSIFADLDETDKFWLLVYLNGRRVPVDNRDTEDGSFHSARHARWYLERWAVARFPVDGLSALGFDPLPADTRSEEEALDLIPETPTRHSLHWQPMFATA